MAGCGVRFSNNTAIAQRPLEVYRSAGDRTNTPRLQERGPDMPLGTKRSVMGTKHRSLNDRPEVTRGLFIIVLCLSEVVFLQDIVFICLFAESSLPLDARIRGS